MDNTPGAPSAPPDPAQQRLADALDPADRAEFDRLMARAPTAEQEARLRRTLETARRPPVAAQRDEFGFCDTGNGTKTRVRASGTVDSVHVSFEWDARDDDAPPFTASDFARARAARRSAQAHVKRVVLSRARHRAGSRSTAPRRTHVSSGRPAAGRSRRTSTSRDDGDSDSADESEPPWLPGHGDHEEQPAAWRPPLLARIADRLNPRLGAL